MIYIEYYDGETAFSLSRGSIRSTIYSRHAPRCICGIVEIVSLCVCLIRMRECVEVHIYTHTHTHTHGEKNHICGQCYSGSKSSPNSTSLKSTSSGCRGLADVLGLSGSSPNGSL